MPRRRPFGSTGIEVSEVGLGGIPLIRVEDMEEAAKIIHHALDGGINYLDTARAYKTSEAKFGLVLRERRSECFLATKTDERTKAGALRQLQESLDLLQTDYVDLWQLHDVSTASLWEQVIGPDGALAAAKEARAQGKIRLIGITGHNVDILRKAIDSGEFDSLLCVYNLAIHDTGEAVMRPAAEAGMAVVVMKPLSGGIFFRHLKAKEAEKQITPEIAWRFVLSNPHLSVALAGAQELRDVDQAMNASDNFRPLSSDEAAPYVELAQSLGEDVCRDCRYCSDCPQSIEVWRIMQMSDRARVFPYEWPKFRAEYASLEVKADACVECGHCEEKCPFDLNIIERLKKAHEQFNRPV
ncbi:MAG: aldo/keto reductase [Candidatus Zipacnadales bacterium]